jgi:tetratricopeptide (TPR) repeat protein
MRRVIAVKPKRTPAQRLETVKKIRKQYETIAKATPRREKAKVVDPVKLPKNIKTLPAAEGSRLLAGVGEYYNDRGEFDRAIEFFADSVTLDDKNTAAKSGYSEALALKGNDLLVKDDAATAKAVFIEAIKLNPRNAAAYFGLGEVYSALDQYPEAIANYERSLENDKDLTEIYIPLGILYYQSGDIAKADALLTKALASSAGSAETQFFLGLVRAAQNRDEDALEAFAKAKTLDPTLAEAFFYSGETLVRLKRTKDAVADYKKAVDLKPEYFDAWLGLGEAYFETGDYTNATNAYKTAAKLKNDNWEVFAGLGESYRMQKQYNDAEANYNLGLLFLTKAQDFNKETAADIYSKVAYVIGSQCELNRPKFLPCKWSAAIKATENAIALLDNPVDYANLGWTYYNAARSDMLANRAADAKPKLEQAKTALQKALTGPPAIHDGVLQNLGAVQIDLGDFRGAIESLKPVTEHKPDWVFSKYALGTAYFKVNDFGNAAKAFRAAVDKDPDNVAALSSLGVSEVRLKNGKEVKKIIEKLRTLSVPDAVRLEQEARAAKL